MRRNERAKPAWWVINETDLLHMLRRVEAGEAPELVFAEHYANSGHESYEDGV